MVVDTSGLPDRTLWFLSSTSSSFWVGLAATRATNAQAAAGPSSEADRDIANMRDALCAPHFRWSQREQIAFLAGVLTHETSNSAGHAGISTGFLGDRRRIIDTDRCQQKTIPLF